MTVTHLTEKEIQEFVLGEMNADRQSMAREHIRSCTRCRSLADSFECLFSALKEEEKPAFDFDLAGQVLAQTKAPVATDSPSRPVIPIFVLLAAAFLMAAVFLLKEFLALPFARLSVLTISLVAGAAGLLLVFLGADLYRQYRKQLELLKFS